MKLLKPILDKDKYSRTIEKDIYSLLYENIFAPLYKILIDKPYIENSARSMLLSYLRSGKLTYEGSFFRGKLNASVSRQLREYGGKYHKTAKAYSIAYDKLPIEVKVAIAQGASKASGKLKEVEDFLKAVEGRKIPTLDFKAEFGRVCLDIDKDFVKTTKEIIPENLVINITPSEVERLRETYSENLDLYIQKWHDEQIIRLRNRVLQNTMKGFRSENLIKVIQRENKVTFNKAKFLARQETSLLVSKYRRMRYVDNGIDWYMWSTAHDVRVRHDHRLLAGSFHQFSNPPVTDLHTMARNNPGEDYNCRCVPIPVLSENKIAFLNKQKEEANR